jgi:hypothetical protein
MKLNHVAVRVPRAALDEPSRSDILAFCGAVFGWREGDNAGERDDPLVMTTGSFGEFVYLARSDDPALLSERGELDHFGVLVESIEEMKAISERASAFESADRHAHVTDIGARTTNGPTATYTLTSCYITYAPLPTVELQHLHRH